MRIARLTLAPIGLFAALSRAAPPVTYPPAVRVAAAVGTGPALAGIPGAGRRAR